MGSSYRTAAATLWGEAGAYAHDAYARLRAEHLPELPENIPIVIGITAYGRCTALTRAAWDAGPRITLASNLFGEGRAMVDDVLLHEMVHAALFLRGEDGAHQSDAWYAEVNRLSPAVLGRELGVKRGADRRSVRVDGSVRKVRVDDAVPHGLVAAWPSPFRPAGYDWGAPIPCPTY